MLSGSSQVKWQVGAQVQTQAQTDPAPAHCVLATLVDGTLKENGNSVDLSSSCVSPFLASRRPRAGTPEKFKNIRRSGDGISCGGREELAPL